MIVFAAINGLSKSLMSSSILDEDGKKPRILLCAIIFRGTKLNTHVSFNSKWNTLTLHTENFTSSFNKNLTMQSQIQLCVHIPLALDTGTEDDQPFYQDAKCRKINKKIKRLSV